MPVTTYNLKLNGVVNTIVQDSQYAYIGGDFTQASVMNVDRYARLSGTNASLVGSPLTFNGNVLCSVKSPDGNYIYLGGSFTTCNGNAAQRIVKVRLSDYSIDTTFDTASGFNASVTTLAVDSAGNLYAGGSFYSYKGTMRYYVAKLNGSTAALDTTFDSATGFSQNILQVIHDGSNGLFVIGWFSAYKGSTRNYIVKLNATTAALDSTFNTSGTTFSNGLPYVMAYASGSLYVGGSFTSYKGTNAQRIVKINGTTAAIDTTFDTTSGFSSSEVRALALDSSGNIYAGGWFSSYKGVTTRQVAKLNASTAALDTTFDTGTGFGGGSNEILSLATDNSSVYVGGGFTTYKGTTRQNIVKLNASTAALDTTFDTADGFDAKVTDLKIDGSNLAVIGEYSTYKTTNFTVQRLAKIVKATGLLDSSFNTASAFNGSVTKLVLRGSSLYVGGTFSTYKGTGRTRLAKINTNDASLDTTFVPAGPNNTVMGLAVDDSGVYFAGSFNQAGVASRQNIAKVNATTGAIDTTFDTSTGFDSQVNTITLDNSGNLYAGGYFGSYKGTNRAYIAKINATTAALDTTFNSSTGFDGSVEVVRLDSSGNLYAAGIFSNYKSTSRKFLAKLNATTAALDTTFDTAVTSFSGAYVKDIALDNSNLYAAGEFYSYKGTTSNRLIKLNSSTAARDTTFNVSTGFDSAVYAVSLNDSDLYVGGGFLSYQSSSRPSIAKINTTDATLQSTFIYSPDSAPTDILLSSSSIAENSAIGSVVGTMSAVDAQGGTITFSLVSGDGSTDNNSFSISGNQLLTAVALNYETKSSYSIRIRATDSTDLTYEETFTISVTNVNEAPFNISLSSAAIAENNEINAVIGTLSSTDPEGSQVTYTLLGTDAASFNINGNELRASEVFNYEVKSSYSIAVRASDGVNNTDQAFTINIANTNEAPNSIALSSSTIAERNAINAVIGTLSATDPEGNPLTWSISGTDAADFNLNGNELRASVAFNYDTKSSYSITIRATDNAGLYSEQSFTITIQQRITFPTLSMSSVSEKKGINTVVGTFSAFDPNGQPITFSLQSGSEYFNIYNNQLRTSQSFDHNAQKSYNIVVRASAGNDYADSTFEIQILNTSYSTNNFDTSYWKVDESGNLYTGGMIGYPTTAYLFDPNVMDANGINKNSLNLGPAEFDLFKTTLMPPDGVIPNAEHYLLSNWVAKGWGNTVEEVVGAFNNFVAAAFINSSQALQINPWGTDMSSYIVFGNVGGSSYVAPYLCYASQGSS